MQLDLFDTNASLTAKAQVTSGGTYQGAANGSASLLAPIPVAGPQYRLYLTNSPRLFVEGNLYGMYLFGCGGLHLDGKRSGANAQQAFQCQCRVTRSARGW